MTRIISVSPTAFGWSLRIDAQESVLVFATGALAEHAARDLARRLADAGQSAEILIYLRDGSMAGTLRSTPSEPAPRPRAEMGQPLESAAA
ncbi:MAG: hypothetical protein JWP86_1876 [Phenylobacterium sp.]|nr:hypothetical protein [Phenylobacterium sp.]MDB5494539.1 hypothetical protein [Phenylobacterium sp.]